MEAERAVAAGGQLSIQVQISPGELSDKITILEIKCERISDPDKLANVRKELQILTAARDEAFPPSDRSDRLARDLKTVNESLWDIEDQIRDCERVSDFGDTFVSLARSVYRMNDRRATLKREINEFLGSAIIEEKSYAAF
jgi:hypothetical protein